MAADTLTRFVAKLNKHGPRPAGAPELGECWLWLAQTDRHGYGYFWWDGQSRPAYRYSYTLVNGEVPQGLELDHLCRTRNCVRPTHLEAVTHQENLRRGNAGANLVAVARSKTHCPQGHAYDLFNTRITKDGHRQCVICKTEQGRRGDKKRLSGWQRSMMRGAS